MFRLVAVTFLICCAILAVADSYPLVEEYDSVATYQGDTVPVRRVVPVVLAEPRRRHHHRPYYGGGFGGLNSGSNANSFSTGFNSPFGGFQATGSSANAFGSGGYYG